MSLRELEAEFYGRYEKPVIEEYILGYSGIDPPLKAGVARGEQDHERLNNLLGGNDYGHYHLTENEYYELQRLLFWPPEIESGQELDVICGEEMTEYEVKGNNVRRTN